jgi:hypothetical protein
MDLDGSLGQMELGGDLAVGPAGGDEGEDGLFPVGEPGEQVLLLALPARVGDERQELPDQPACRGGGEGRLAGLDGTDRAEQIGGRRVLEQKSAGTGLERGEHVLVEVEGGQDEHPGRGGGGADLGRCLDAVHAGHPDVHQHQVGVQGRGHGDGRGAVGCLADHLDVGLGLQDQPEAHPKQCLVVGEQDADHAVSRSSRAFTRQPFGCRGPVVTSPP